MRTPLERIATRLRDFSAPGGEPVPGAPLPLLTLSEFFDGNECVGSICCNLDAIPSPKDVLSVLQRIESRPDVYMVLVQVTMFDDPDWPFSDTVWVITDADEQEVLDWFPADIRPDDVWEGWVESQEYEPVQLLGGRPIACWWD